MLRLGQTHSRHKLALLSLSVGLVLWTAVSSWLGNPEVLPSPWSVATAARDMLRSGEVGQAVRHSLLRVAAGYAVGVVAGVVTGVVLGGFPIARHTLEPMFGFLKGIPPIALVPLAVMWMGIGEVSKIAVIGYLVWIVVAISTAVGVGEVPRIRLRSGQVLGLSGSAIFVRVILPSALPYILAGMRSAIGFAFVALVSAELIAASSGVGQIIMDSRFSLQTARMIVGLLVLGTLGAVTQALFDRLVARVGGVYTKGH